MVEFGPNGQVIDTGSVPSSRPPKKIDYKAEGKTFHSLRGRYKFVRFFLIAYFVATAALIIGNAAEVYYLSVPGIDIVLDGQTPFELAVVIGIFIAALAMIGTYVVCVIAVSMWTHRAMTNLHILRSPAVEMSPNWAVGWYFIPIASLFKPFQGMAQIWEGSLAAAKQALENRGRLNWWWGTWIASNIISNGSIRVFGLSPEGDAYLTSLYFDILSAVLSLFATWFLLKITRQVTEAQDNIQLGVEATFA